MIRMIMLLIILLAGFIGGLLVSYDVQFNSRQFDMTVMKRNEHKKGYGINFKDKRELWAFEERLFSTEKKKLFP